MPLSCNLKRKEKDIEFEISDIPIMKQERPTHHALQRASLAKSPVCNSIRIVCRRRSHQFLNFSDNHLSLRMVSSWRLKVNAFYFYLGELIHFKNKVFLPIDDLS